MTALMWASTDDNLEVVNALLAAGVDKGAMDKVGDHEVARMYGDEGQGKTDISLV